MKLLKKDIYSVAEHPMETDKINFLFLIKFFTAYVSADYKYIQNQNNKKYYHIC